MDGFGLVSGVDEANVVEEAILLLERQEIRLRANGIGRHRCGQDDVQVAYGRLRRLPAPGLHLAHEGDAPDGVRAVVLDADAERQAVLAEGAERQRQLLSRLGHRDDVTGKLQVLRLGLQHLHQ